ncbi:protease HtpX [Oceanospirillum beijerinckii]|uniref:protease HtpX n=1 Tax=Oceanospirillum beijerinckii TaxID=64976 RepID=UPI00041F6EA5|nr:protease HtpX [Oceanospirillum beijerinckii]
MMRIGLFLLTNLAVLVVAGVVLSLLGVGSYREGSSLNMVNLLIICAVFGFSGSLISLFMSKMMAKMGTGTQLIEQPRNETEAWLLQTVEELSQKAGIKMPEVGIFPSMESNAFATGWNKNDALVAVSAGLLQRMNPEEVRAVLAHEIGHVANGDMVTLAMIQGVVNTFVMFVTRCVVYAIDQFTADEEGEGGLGWVAELVLTIVLDTLFGILASGIVAWFSRRREFKADQAGAELADRQAMISALQRLKAEYEGASGLQGSMTALGISGGKMSAFFASHPPLDDRIAALQQGR